MPLLPFRAFMACCRANFIVTYSYKTLICKKREVQLMFHPEDDVLSDATGSPHLTDLEVPSGYDELLVCD
jgi:hypothetical protein